MKYALLTLLAGGLLTNPANAQSTANSPASGKITYEGMRRVDLSQARMVINGQEVRPGAGDAPEGLPDVISFTQKLVFSGTMAKEERDRQAGPGMMFRRGMGDGNGPGNGPGDGDRSSRPRSMSMTPPFEQTTYLDLANRKTIEVLTTKSDSASQTYRTDRPMPTPDGWQLSDKTKKIAGYLCHKATVAYSPSRPVRRNRADSTGRAASAPPAAQTPAETYTIWYTTDLPFTYSPVAALTPEKGVVLLIESDSQSFKATSVSSEAVPETSVQPPKDAKVVSSDEMNELRRKGMANFRQRMMNNMPFSGAPRN